MISREQLQKDFLESLSDLWSIQPAHEKFARRPEISPEKLKKIIALIEAILHYAQVITAYETYQKLNTAEFKSTHDDRDIINIINTSDDDGNTLLIRASECGWPEIVRALIDAKASINAQNNVGATALIRAAEYGRLDIVQMLINAKAEPDIQCNKGKTALTWAAGYHEQPEMTRTLIKAGANPNPKTADGNSPLIEAAMFWEESDSLAKPVENTQLLLEAKADVNYQSEAMTALDCAIENDQNNFEEISLLLTHGAKVSDFSKLLSVCEQQRSKNQQDPYPLTCIQIVDGMLSEERAKIDTLKRGCSNLLSSSSLSTSATILSSLPSPSTSSPVVVATEEKPSAPRANFPAKRKASSELYPVKTDTESDIAQPTLSRLRH